MDCHGYIGNALKAEKLTAALYLSEFFVGLVVVLLTWDPAGLVVAVGATGNCLRHVSDIFNRPVSVFLVSNAIVAAVVVLSSGKGPNGDCCSGTGVDDKCEPRRRRTPVCDSSPAVEVDDDPPPLPPALEKKENTDSAAAETSEVEDHEESMDVREPRGELIKLDGHDDVCGEESERRGSVDDLSTEEFNRTVEKYIARTKEFLYKEHLDDILINASRKTADCIV